MFTTYLLIYLNLKQDLLCSCGFLNLEIFYLCIQSSRDTSLYHHILFYINLSFKSYFVLSLTVCLCVCLCVSLRTWHQFPEKPEEGTGFIGTRVIDGCDLSHCGWLGTEFWSSLWPVVVLSSESFDPSSHINFLKENKAW